MSVLSAVALTAAVLLAVLFGDLSMRGRMPEHAPDVQMPPGMKHG